MISIHCFEETVAMMTYYFWLGADAEDFHLC